MRHVFATALAAASLLLLALAPSAGAAPTAAFRWSPTVPNPGQTVTFSTSSTVCDVSPCTYDWVDVAADGPGVPDYAMTAMAGSAPTFTFRFANLGTKYVQLTVTNGLGQRSTVQHDLVVAPAPLWTGDFDTCDTSQWGYRIQSGQLLGGDPDAFGTTRIDAVTDPAGTRTNAGCAARFQVDTWVDRGRDPRRPTPSAGHRAEVYTDEHMTEGTEYWYGTSIYIPAASTAVRDLWSATTSHNTLTQWKGQGLGAPPLQIGAPFWANGRADDGLGIVDADDSGGIETFHRLVPFDDMFNRWHDFAIRVKFSADPRVGEYEVYLNGREAVPTTSTRTLIATDRPSYLKQGLYTDNDNGRVVIIDETRRGTSQAAVDPSLLLVD